MATDYSGQLERVMAAYRTNMTQYKMTGRPEYKRGADIAERWLSQYLQWMESSVTSNSNYINKFVADYSTTNPDLVALQQKIKTIKTEGPKLEDAYLTDKEAAETSPRDMTPYYVKGGVILGIGALVAALSFF